MRTMINVFQLDISVEASASNVLPNQIRASFYVSTFKKLIEYLLSVCFFPFEFVVCVFFL